MQTVCTSLQTDNHTNTSSLDFYRSDALPGAQSVKALNKACINSPVIFPSQRWMLYKMNKPGFSFFVRVLVFILAHLKRWCLSDFVILALVSLEERLWHDPFLCRMVRSHFTPSIGSPVCYLHSHIMWQDLCNSTVSVHLPVCPIYQPLQQQVCCCGPSRQEISIGHCRSTACSSKGEQCHVVSWRMKLKTDLFKLFG